MEMLPQLLPVEDEEIIDEPKADGKAHGKSTH